MRQDTSSQVDFRSRMIAFLPRLRRFCMAMAGSEDRGDDLMQATVERALTRQEQCQAGTSLESWMFRIAQNIHIDQARAAKRRGQSVDIEELAFVAGSDGRQIVEARSQLDHARAAMAALPEEQRALMALIVLDGQSYKEAAVMLDLPIGTVMSRLARARAAIDLALQNKGSSDG